MSADPDGRTGQCGMEASDHPVRVVVAEPRESTRTALCALLSAEPGLVVVGGVRDVVAAMRVVRARHVDVVVIEASLAGLGTTDRRDALAALSRRVPIVVMGVDDAESYARPLQVAGADGYWPKDATVAALAATLRSAAADAAPRARVPLGRARRR